MNRNRKLKINIEWQEKAIKNCLISIKKCSKKN